MLSKRWWKKKNSFPEIENFDFNLAKIVKTFDVNVLAHFWTLKAFLPGMIEAKKGHIVSVASMAGYGGINKLVDYCASKFADIGKYIFFSFFFKHQLIFIFNLVNWTGLDEALRVELSVRGHSDYIKTTVVCPYYIATGMFAGVQSKLIPILEPEYVAAQTVQVSTSTKWYFFIQRNEILKSVNINFQAILINKEVLMLPWWLCFLVALRTMLPTKGQQYLSHVFGLNCSMDQFEGRAVNR